MACCAPNTLGAGPAADACKRVNYTLGMLLGVDDFVQESAYHTARRHELARELLGYGTVHGLQVIVEPDGDRGPRLRITPGMAWLPSGTPVCVDTPQCANLNDWLAAHAAEVDTALLASPAVPSPLTLFVVLSHAQCLTDNVPIPGEPCRSEDELMQPSRVTDSFRLELRLSPPPQREEDAIRDFVEWLVRLPVAPASPPLTEAQFIEELRRAAREWLAPTSPPVEPSDFMLGAAPEGTGEELFRTALRLWTTELRPLWMARAACGCNAPPIPPRDDALLLAELSIDLASGGSPGGWRVSDVEPAVTADQSRRPILLSLRMVQELVMRHGGGAAGGGGTAPALPELGGDLSGPIEAARIESLQGVPLVSGSPLADGQVLTVVGGHWAPSAPAAPPLPTLSGDVAGPLASNRIVKLQDQTVDAAAPGNLQILRFVGGKWVAVDLPSAPPGQFVGRGTAKPYEIVAAGQVRVRVSGTTLTPTIEPPGGYGNLTARGANLVTGDPRQALVELRASVDGNALPNYIVKLTPVWLDLTKHGFRVFLRDPVTQQAVNRIDFRVLLLTDQTVTETAIEYLFQVEVSRF